MSANRSNPYPTLTPEELHPYGTIRRTHGYEGEVVVGLSDSLLYSATPRFLFIVHDEIPVPYAVEGWRGNRDQLIVALSEVEDMDTAQTLVGNAVLIHESELPAKVTRAVATQLYHTNGTLIGNIVDIDTSTLNRLMTIERPDGTSLHIPYVEEWITDENEEQHTLTLNFPLELLSL